MRSTYRKLCSCLLLATYVGISVLGQGLHSLTPEDGHHHGINVVYCTTPGHVHDHDSCVHEQYDAAAHVADHHQTPTGPIVTAGGCATDSHSCEICEFLFQAVGQPPQVAAVPNLHPLVAVAACPHHGIYSPAVLGLHAARGPPQLLA